MFGDNNNTTTEVVENALLRAADTTWILLTGINILLMQVGFTAFESGASRAKHVKSVLFKNFLDHSIGALAWFFVGWGIYTGNDPFLGMGNFGDPAEKEYARLFQQFGFAATASTIISGAVSGRMRLEAYLFLSMIICGFTYPLQAHWMWSPSGWLAKLGFRDFAGSCVVHTFGGSCAFACALLVGSRPGRFQYQRRQSAFAKPQQRKGSVSPPDDSEAARTTNFGNSESSAGAVKESANPRATWAKFVNRITPGFYDAAPMPPAGNALMMVIGALILYISWFSFNTGSSGSVIEHPYQSARAAVNTLLCSGAGCTTFFLQAMYGAHRPRKGDVKGSMYNMESACNALLVSLASITAPCAYIHPWAAVLCGVFAVAFAYPLGEAFVLRICGVDDTLGAVSVHAFGGIFGTLWLGLTHPDSGAFYTGQGGFFGVQLLAAILSTLVGFSTTLLVLLPFRHWGVLRYSLEEQLLGIDFLHFGGDDARDVDLDSNSSRAGDDVESVLMNSTGGTSQNEPQIILTPPMPNKSGLSDSDSNTLSLNTAQGRIEAGNQLKRALDDEDPRVRRRFRAYLQVLHAGESVEFWDEVNKWKRHTRNEKKRIKESARIINQYCLDESPTQVNLKSSTVVKLRAALMDSKLLARDELFDECLDELFKDLKLSFIQFVERTPNYWL